MSILTSSISSIWKTKKIIPVPKKSTNIVMHDLRPVALTSVAVKCLEKLILRKLNSHMRILLDPCQFAYQSKCSVEDAILIFINIQSFRQAQ